MNNDKIEELSKRTVQLFEKKNSVIYMRQKENSYIAILLKEKI